jgi:PKD repeat protein
MVLIHYFCFSSTREKNMKKHLRLILASFLALAFASSNAFAQCPNTGTLVAGNLTPPGVGQSTTQTYSAGQYVLANVVAGANYTVSTCGNSSVDTQLTIYEDLTGNYIAYNDDFCGLQSTVSFTPTFCGDVRVLLNIFYCGNSSSSVDVTMTMNTAGTGMPMLTAAPDEAACNGSQVNIGIPNNGSGGLTPYAYLWNPAINLTSTTTSQTTATVTGTMNYDLTLTDANGCKAYDTVQVTVLPNPTVNLGNDTTVCGGPFLLDAGNPGATYLWSTGAGTQTLSVPTGGNYSVSVQNAQGCIGSDAINITINPLPIVSLGADTTSCSASVTLDAGAGFSSYAWSTGSTAQTATTFTTGPVDVIVTDANGCAGTDTVNVSLSPTPSITLGPDTAQCGGNVTLDAGNPGSLYFWSNSTSAQTTTVNTTGTYSVLVVSPAGCSNSDTINVTINNQPSVDLGPDMSICTATTTLDAGNPGDVYFWNTLASTQTITVGNGTYDVTVTDPSGCTDQDTITVTTNAAPNISAGQDQTICPSQSATLTGIGGLNYLWSTGATTPSITVSPSSTTTYYVTGFDINGCSASDVVTVSVLPASTALFSEVVVGATAVFTNQSTNAVSYSWNFGDLSPLDNSANPSHTYAANGSYVVTLTVTGPCGTATFTQTVVITQVGLQDNDLASTLSLFPNPNDGTFTLSFDFSNSKDVTIEVLDVTGRIIYADKESDIMSYNKQIGLESAESGMYMIRIITNDGVVTEKMVIQR